jgi:asparagine synthase (glutamine-hydrolysing)
MPDEVTLPQFVFDQKPFLEGPAAIEAYLDAFDRTIDNAMEGTQPLAATLSGGLDSSFVVASLALKTTSDRPVHAFSHRPHPDAKLSSIARWDPDDSGIALELEKAYPGRVQVTRVFNEELIQPLDAAHAAAHRSWWPTFNPANQIWIDEFQRRGRDLGASALFIGQKGNASFSAEPSYAASYYFSHGRLDKILALAQAGHPDGMSFLASLRSRVLAPVKAQVLGRKRSSRVSVQLLWDADALRPSPQTRLFDGRSAFLSWLDPTTASHMGAAHHPGAVLPFVDPFTAAGVIVTAARITPLDWTRGPFPRGFARRAGIGRVPDPIRLRTRRGGQSWDVWFVMRFQKDRYFSEITLLAQTPVLAELVNHHAVKALADSWDWDDPAPPNSFDVSQVIRLLALADFVRLTRRRLSALTVSDE